MKYLLDIEKVITENPNVIFQVTGADLKAFAEQLLIGAKAIAMQEVEDAARNDKLLSVEEAAELLSVSKMTLYRWCIHGSPVPLVPKGMRERDAGRHMGTEPRSEGAQIWLPTPCTSLVTYSSRR